MKGMNRAALVVIWVCLISIKSFAAPIVFTHSGTGSGFIGGLSFSDSAFTITAVGDTSAVTGFFGGYFINHTSASISIEGAGDFHFTSSTRTFVNNHLALVGFSRAGMEGLDLFNGPTDPAFGSWTMLTDIGPMTGDGYLVQWGAYESVLTDHGTLRFNERGSPVTFRAPLVPEPACAMLLMCGAALCCRRRFWRQRRT
jgi:hypothetical protein